MGSAASEASVQAGPSSSLGGSSFRRGIASVVINNHNYAAFLVEAIESALGQTYAPLEVVVVDDGSSDGSRDIIEAYGGRLVAVLVPHSRGQGAAINAGVAASRGEFVFLLDSDDVFVTTKVEQVVAEFERHPGAGACFHGLEYLGNPGSREAPPLELSGLCDFRNDFRAGRLPFISTTTSALCFRRSALEPVLPLPELPGNVLGDHFLKWATLGTCPVLFDQRRLTFQRLHDRNLYTRSRTWREVSEKESINALWLRRRLPAAARVSRRLMVQSVARRLRHGEAPRRSNTVAEYCAEAGRGESAAIIARAVALLAVRGARMLVSRGADTAETEKALAPRQNQVPMRFRRDVQDALRWRVAAARARLRNGLNLLGWQRDQRVAISAGPELPVVFCTWQRLERLDWTLAQLAAQTIPVQAVIWNNSPQRRLVELKAAAAGIRTTVHHSPRNIGGFGRFYLARELAEMGHEAVIFIDDDQDFPPTMASDLVSQHRPRSIGGWWAYSFASDDYFDRERVEVGERASYIGTCGMISDTAVFNDPQVFQCPRRFWFVEDLWLSFVAGWLHGWNLSRGPVDFTWVPDGRDQFLRLGNTKTQFLRYLIRQGWNVGGVAGDRESESAGSDAATSSAGASEAS